MSAPKFKKSTIVKLIVVLLSIAFIITAGIIAMQREKRNVPPEEETLAEDTHEEKIDEENALLLSIVPSFEDPVSFNGLTRSDCEVAVKDGSMILLHSANGSSVYVNNYHDDELLKKEVSTEDDFKTWLYSGFAVFDIDKELVREMYKEALEKYVEYVKTTERTSLQEALSYEGVSVDEFVKEEAEVAYRYYCDLEMSEAILNDTIGDVTDEEIDEFASSEGYGSAESMIKEYGRFKILYYLRPQKLLKYIEQRMEEIR